MGTPPPAAAVTVVGECVADAFTDRTASAGEVALRVLPGGGPANTAAALARLGTPTRFLGRLSDDVFGALFRSRLIAAGVDLTGSVAAPEHSTLAVADVDADGKAGYTFFADGAADWQWTGAELAAVPQDTACVHTGSLALVRPPGARHIEEYLAAMRAGATISVDPNVRLQLVPPTVYRDGLRRWCRLADILRVSQDDLEQLLPGTSAEDACDTWHAAGVPLVVVTLGEEGALASLDGVRVAVPSSPVDVVDTVGAGDAFTAGLLHRLGVLGRLGGRLDSLTTDELADACAFGVQIAAATCTVPGADPPLAERAPDSTRDPLVVPACGLTAAN
jgi:fructokinase